MERMPPARGPPLPCAARVCGTGVRSTHLADRAEDAFETEASPGGMPWPAL